MLYREFLTKAFHTCWLKSYVCCDQYVFSYSVSRVNLPHRTSSFWILIICWLKKHSYLGYIHTLIMLHRLWINMCHVLDVEHRFRCVYRWGADISLKFMDMYACVCVRQRAPIRHSNANIPGKSAGRNLLSNVFHPLLLVSGQCYDSPLISKSLWINAARRGTKAKDRVHCSVFTKCTWILCC